MEFKHLIVEGLNDLVVGDEELFDLGIVFLSLEEMRSVRNFELAEFGKLVGHIDKGVEIQILL